MWGLHEIIEVPVIYGFCLWNRTCLGDWHTKCLRLSINLSRSLDRDRPAKQSTIFFYKPFDRPIQSEHRLP